MLAFALGPGGAARFRRTTETARLVIAGAIGALAVVEDNGTFASLSPPGVAVTLDVVPGVHPSLRSRSGQELAAADIVVNTHPYLDHCGGNHLVAGRPTYVRHRELDDARSEDDYTITDRVDAPGVRYVPVGAGSALARARARAVAAAGRPARMTRGCEPDRRGEDEWTGEGPPGVRLPGTWCGHDPALVTVIAARRFVGPVPGRRLRGVGAVSTHHDEGILMTTMTCRQLGGPCEFELSGETADEVIKAQDRHLRDAVRGGDAAHEPAHAEMKSRWRHPVRGMGWYRDTKKAFAALAGG